MHDFLEAKEVENVKYLEQKTNRSKVMTTIKYFSEFNHINFGTFNFLLAACLTEHPLYDQVDMRDDAEGRD